MVAVFKSVELAEKGWCPMSIPKILFVHEISISRKHFHIFFFFGLGGYSGIRERQ